MAMKTNSYIKFPEFALRIRTISRKRDGLGTGFVVKHYGSTWLFTCWHNISTNIDQSDLTLNQEIDVDVLILVKYNIVVNLKNRRIIGAKLDGNIIDAAAIELNDQEIKSAPWFSGGIEMSFEGPPPPSQIAITGHNSNHSAYVEVQKSFLWQGFPGGGINNSHVSAFAHQVPGLKAQQPWMLCYMPGGKPGTSGSPIIQIQNNIARIAGIHVHFCKSNVKFMGKLSSDHRPVIINCDLEWGCAVPVELLYKAIELSPLQGVCITSLDHMKIADIT